MENKAELSAARRDVEALSLDEDPLVVAQASVDKLTGILARLLDDDNATIASGTGSRAPDCGAGTSRNVTPRQGQPARPHALPCKNNCRGERCREYSGCCFCNPRHIGTGICSIGGVVYMGVVPTYMLHPLRLFSTFSPHPLRSLLERCGVVH
jgi:hypothetical protein